MPVYQAQQEFDQTMCGLQTSSSPCTVLVVDDGSQPPLEVGDYGPGLEVCLLRLPKNQGIVGALNAGLKAALAAGFEFIARIDAGDFASSHRLARQVAYLETHPRCMMVGTDAEVRNEDGSYCFTIEPPRNPAVLAEALHERAWILHPTVMYRSSVFRDLGLYTDRFAAAEDYEMFLRIASRYEIGVVPEALMIYVVRNGSISARKARVQAISRLRVQLLYFKWTKPMRYYGVLRTCGTLLMPRWMKNVLKMKFLYTRVRPDSSGGSLSVPLEVRKKA
jgi:glycosyltransferase involved in cell wall biosynthesis